MNSLSAKENSSQSEKKKTKKETTEREQESGDGFKAIHIQVRRNFKDTKGGKNVFSTPRSCPKPEDGL